MLLVFEKLKQDEYFSEYIRKHDIVTQDIEEMFQTKDWNTFFSLHDAFQFVAVELEKLPFSTLNDESFLEINVVEGGARRPQRARSRTPVPAQRARTPQRQVQAQQTQIIPYEPRQNQNRAPRYVLVQQQPQLRKKPRSKYWYFGTFFIIVCILAIIFHVYKDFQFNYKKVIDAYLYEQRYGPFYYGNWGETARVRTNTWYCNTDCPTKEAILDAMLTIKTFESFAYVNNKISPYVYREAPKIFEFLLPYFKMTASSFSLMGGVSGGALNETVCTMISYACAIALVSVVILILKTGNITFELIKLTFWDCVRWFLPLGMYTIFDGKYGQNDGNIFMHGIETQVNAIAQALQLSSVLEGTFLGNLGVNAFKRKLGTIIFDLVIKIFYKSFEAFKTIALMFKTLYVCPSNRVTVETNLVNEKVVSAISSILQTKTNTQFVVNATRSRSLSKSKKKRSPKKKASPKKKRSGSPKKRVKRKKNE